MFLLHSCYITQVTAVLLGAPTVIRTRGHEQQGRVGEEEELDPVVSAMLKSEREIAALVALSSCDNDEMKFKAQARLAEIARIIE